MNEERAVKKLLLIGIAGGILTMIGDFLLMGADAAGAGSMIEAFLIEAQKISYTRIGFAAFFGYVGIPVCGAGYYALCRMCRDKDCRLYRIYRDSMFAFAVLGGGIHIVCCFIMTGLKKNMETGTLGTDAVMATIKEQAGYLAPCMLVFLTVYAVFAVSLILLIAKRKTSLPAWLALINPFTMKILLNVVRFLGYSAFINGLSGSNMSFGAIVIFLFWYMMLKKMTLAEGADHCDFRYGR